MTWECPLCSSENSDTILRCACGHEATDKSKSDVVGSHHQENHDQRFKHLGVEYVQPDISFLTGWFCAALGPLSIIISAIVAIHSLFNGYKRKIFQSIALPFWGSAGIYIWYTALNLLPIAPIDPNASSLPLRGYAIFIVFFIGYIGIPLLGVKTLRNYDWPRKKVEGLNIMKYISSDAAVVRLINGKIALRLKKEGFKDIEVALQKKHNGWSIGDMFFSSMAGIGVNFSNGGIYRLKENELNDTLGEMRKNGLKTNELQTENVLIVKSR